MGHSFDMLTFDFLLKPPQPVTGLFLYKNITGKISVTQGKLRENTGNIILARMCPPCLRIKQVECGCREDQYSFALHTHRKSELKASINARVV